MLCATTSTCLMSEQVHNAELSGATRLYRGTSRLSDGLDAAASQERRLKMIAALYVETDGAYFGQRRRRRINHEKPRRKTQRNFLSS